MIESDERYTPAEVLAPLTKLFGPMYDPCPRGWISSMENGLKGTWGNYNCFVNPPYSQIEAWVDKTLEEVARGAFVAFLIPNDCSTKAFRKLKGKAWGRWEIPFRVKFTTPEGKKVDVARSHVVFFLGGLP